MGLVTAPDGVEFKRHTDSRRIPPDGDRRLPAEAGFSRVEIHGGYG